jgi:mRNA interferase HicA
MLKAAEFKRRVSRLAKARGVTFDWDPKHGKGSHGTLTFGTNFTTVKDLKKELGIGLLDSMCADLGITRKDLNNV